MFICSIVMLRLLELGTGSRCDFNVAGCCWSSSCSWITFNETLFYDSCLIVVRLCPYMMISSTAGCSTLARLSVFGSISAGPSGPHCHLEHRFISAAPPCLHPHTFTSARHQTEKHWDDQSSSEGSEGSEVQLVLACERTCWNLKWIKKK